MFFALLFNFYSYFLYSFVASEEQTLKSGHAALLLISNCKKKILKQSDRQSVVCSSSEERSISLSLQKIARKQIFLSFWHPCSANPPLQPTRSLQICNQRSYKQKKKKKVFYFVAVLQLMGLCKTAKTGKK